MELHTVLPPHPPPKKRTMVNMELENPLKSIPSDSKDGDDLFQHEHPPPKKKCVVLLIRKSEWLGFIFFGLLQRIASSSEAIIACFFLPQEKYLGVSHQGSPRFGLNRAPESPLQVFEICLGCFFYGYSI